MLFLNHYAEELFHFSIPSKLVSNAIIALAFLLIAVIIKTYRLKQKKLFQPESSTTLRTEKQ